MRAAPRCHALRQGPTAAPRTRRVPGSQRPRTHATAPSTPQISPEEEERRRVRRERNKLAAAKCRNRRKELTDFLQAVSSSGAEGAQAPAHRTPERPPFP